MSDESPEDKQKKAMQSTMVFGSEAAAAAAAAIKARLQGLPATAPVPAPVVISAPPAPVVIAAPPAGAPAPAAVPAAAPAGGSGVNIRGGSSARLGAGQAQPARPASGPVVVGQAAPSAGPAPQGPIWTPARVQPPVQAQPQAQPLPPAPAQPPFQPQGQIHRHTLVPPAPVQPQAHVPYAQPQEPPAPSPPPYGPPAAVYQHQQVEPQPPAPEVPPKQAPIGLTFFGSVPRLSRAMPLPVAAPPPEPPPAPAPPPAADLPAYATAAPARAAGRSESGRADRAEPPRAARGAPPRAFAEGCLHHYPIAAREAGLGPAVRLAMKTSPFAFYRFLQWSLLSAISLVMLAVAVGGGLALMLYVQRWVGVGVMVGGIVAWALLWQPFVERRSFGALCAHIAILTEFITRGKLGNGRQGMFEFSRKIIERRVGDMATVSNLYRSINSALRKLGRVMRFADGLLSMDTAWVRRLIDRLVAWVSPFLAAVVLSYGLARGDEDFTESGTDGLCYGAQNIKTLMKTALGAVLLEMLLIGPLWLAVFAGGAYSLFNQAYVLMGGNLAVWYAGPMAAARAAPVAFLVAAAAALVVGYLLASLMVKTFRESFVRPALITMMMLKFHLAIEGQALDPAWRDRITGAGDALAGLDKLRRVAL